VESNSKRDIFKSFSMQIETPSPIRVKLMSKESADKCIDEYSALKNFKSPENIKTNFAVKP